MIGFIKLDEFNKSNLSALISILSVIVFSDEINSKAVNLLESSIISKLSLEQ